MAFVAIKDKDNATLGHLQTDAQERLGVHNLLHVQDRKAKGVDGGTFTSGAWRTRVFNTELVNNIPGASLAANRITLPAGTYYIRSFAPATNVSTHTCRLYRVSPNAGVLLAGSSSNSAATNGSTTNSVIDDVVTLAETTVLEIQHACFTTKADTGFGSGYDIGQEYCIFSDFKAWKLS